MQYTISNGPVALRVYNSNRLSRLSLTRTYIIIRMSSVRDDVNGRYKAWNGSLVDIILSVIGDDSVCVLFCHFKYVYLGLLPRLLAFPSRVRAVLKREK